MQAFQREFIEFCLQHKALKFGEFTLKSGRISPYFFNSGVFSQGAALARLGQFYAATIQAAALDFDMLFGPAYKGIPLVCTTAIALAQQYDRNYPYSFDRKLVKTHGEGGNIVGSPLNGKVVLIDDVITAGTAIRHSMPLFEQANAQLAGVVIMLNRQEKGQNELSAIAEIEQTYQVPVLSIINLEQIVEYLSEDASHHQLLIDIDQYRQQYGV